MPLDKHQNLDIILNNLFNVWMMATSVPDDWKNNVITLHKKKNITNMNAKLLGIILLNEPRKVFGIILIERVQEVKCNVALICKERKV